MKFTIALKYLLLTVTLLLSARAEAQILWKISGNGVKADSYLLGTHHIAPPTILDSIEGFDRAFLSCQQLYCEVDMTDMQDVVAKSQQYIMAPADSTLSLILTADELKKVDEAVQKYMHISVENVDMLKPNVLATQISTVQTMMTFSDFEPDKQIDIMLQKRAKWLDMPIKGFETLDDQLSLLYNEPISQQARALLDMLDNEESIIKYTQQLAEAYMRQDLDAIQQMYTPTVSYMTEEELDALLYERNDAWMKQLREILPNTSTFIVVGAGHLPGERGLLSQLRKAGYTLTPVK